MSNNLGDLQKSYELADIINKMKPLLIEMDLDYAKVAVAGMLDMANFHDSAAVLNPGYDPSKTEHLQMQCKALSKLIEYVELLKQCDVLKAKVAQNGAQRAGIMKLFI